MKKLNILSKSLIVILLALAVFAPSILKSKAASYNYDFWKNVIPSAEGLAYQETYYNDSFTDIYGNPLVGANALAFDKLTDLAVYEDGIYILDSFLNAQLPFQAETVINNIKYHKIEGSGVSALHILNQNFQYIGTMNEFLITEEVKVKMQEYYDFYLEGYQLTKENYTSTELISFYDKNEFELEIDKATNEIVIDSSLEIVYGEYDVDSKVYTFSNNDILLYAISDQGAQTKVSKSNWQWLYDEEKATYKIVLDEEITNVEKVKLEYRKIQEGGAGKAPYFAYSQDPSLSAIRLNAAEGLTVTKDGIYIADTGNCRIIRVNIGTANINGVETQTLIVDGVYLTPDDTVFYQVSGGKKLNDATAQDGVKAFKPQKIAVDQTGRLYAIANGVYEGIMEFHKSGAFNRFLGKNEVVANPLKKFWTKLFSETQIANMTKDLPPEFTNIAMDSSGFLFATSYPDADATTNANLVKMINTSGKDIMKRNGYVTPDGDAVYLTTSPEDGVITGMSQLVGVTVSSNGNFTVVDELRGRLFTYDNEGNLLYITGEQPGGNSQAGNTTLSNCIIDPVAIRYFERDSGELDAEGNMIKEEVLLVLDASSKSILLFKTTEFGEAVNIATSLYQQGIVEDIYKTDEDGNLDYDENGEAILVQAGAETYWRQVVKMNTNYELAYLGIGKALLRRGEYKAAMEQFKLAHNATYYSKAYTEYRDIILSDNFNWIMTAVILLVVLWITLSYRKSLKQRNLAMAAKASMNEEKARMIERQTEILRGYDQTNYDDEEEQENSKEEEDK